MIEINKIILGDSLEIMPTIADKTFDLLILDWPYNIKKAEWDRIPNYLEWCGIVLKEHERLLKDNGSIYIFHNEFLTISRIANWIEENTDFIFKQFIFWDKLTDKNRGFSHQRLAINGMRNYYNGFGEYILFYTFQDETGLTAVKLDLNNFTSLRKYAKDFLEDTGMTFKEINNLLGHRKAEHFFYWNTSQWDLPTKETYLELCKLPQSDGFLRREYEDLRREYEDLRREYEDLRYIFNVQNVTNDFRCNSTCWNYSSDNNNGHESPKPEPLIENIIKHSSNEGDLVGDFFAGAGTTGAVCKKLNRNYVLVERDEKYFKQIEKRINNYQKEFIFK